MKSLIDEIRNCKVEWRKLGEIAVIKRGERVTKSKLSPNKPYPVYSGGVMPMGYYDNFNQNKNTITIIKYGTAGFVNFIKEKFWANDVCYCVKPSEVLNNKYLYYFLKNIQNDIQSKATKAIPAHLSTEVVNNIKIPIPPIDIQEKIVKILDRFTELSTELTKKLTTELTARQKQYSYYLNKLLTFKDDEVEWKKLGEVGEIKRGKRVVKSQLSDAGKYPVYQNSMIPLGYYYESNVKANTTFIISAGAAGEIGFCPIDFWAADDVYFFVLPKDLESKFLYYFLLTQQHKISSQVRRASIPRLSKNVIEKLHIPIPPLEKQKEIVAILDKFYTLTNSISEGLPKEIDLRKKQYEYYRNLLLDFK